MKLTKIENDLLIEMFDDYEKHYVSRLNYWRANLKNKPIKEFAESQVFFLERRLIILKCIQTKLIKNEVIFYE